MQGLFSYVQQIGVISAASVPNQQKFAYISLCHIPFSRIVSRVIVHTIRVVITIHSVSAGTVLYECVTPANVSGLRARSIANNSNPYGKGCIVTNAQYRTDGVAAW